jgi:hypothetical protein
MDNVQNCDSNIYRWEQIKLHTYADCVKMDVILNLLYSGLTDGIYVCAPTGLGLNIKCFFTRC